MKGNTDMNGWSELLHSSSKLLEQAAPSAQFPPLQRNLEQLESLSKKLKAKTVRADTPSQSIAATRLLAREGINAEQLARDLKSFEIKTTYEDVFPSEATTVEEYLQQLHEMAMVSAIQEAQKDNLRNFNDHIMRVFEDDWQKVRKDFLQSLSRLSFLPRINSGLSSSDPKHATQNSSKESSPNISGIPSDLTPVVNKSVLEKKALVYSETLRILNDSRARGLPFKPATAFREAYERIGLDHSAGKSVTMQKIWHLIQALAGEGFRVQQSVSKRTSLVNGARRHLEWGHEKYIIETIQAHPAQAALGGAVGNLPRIQAFLRVRLRDHGLLDFDAGDACRQPPIDTTWQQIYFCLRTGYYDEARSIAQTSRASHHFAPLLAEWITAGGMVSAETASIASEECDKILRAGDRAGRPGYDRKKLLLYAIASGCRRQIDRLLRDLPTLFNTIEDFMWFKLSAVRDFSGGSSSVVLSDGLVPYSLEDLQGYLNKFEPSYYTKSGKDPLVYPYVLLLSIQLLPAILHLYKEVGEEGYSIDAVHISIVLADQGCISEGSHKIVSIMDSCAEVAGIIRRFGSLYLHAGKLSLSLDYYAQASAVMGGGELSWIGRASVDQQRQRNLMLKQLLTEILLQDGGISLLLGPRGMGEEGELMKYMMDWKTREEFLLEAATQSQEAGLYEKSVDLHKRVGAFAMALTTINKCLSDAIYAMLRGRLDGDSRVASLIQSGKDILEAFKCSHEASLQEKELYYEQQIVFRQLEAILCIHKLARAGKYMDAVREISNLSFLPLNPKMPEVTMDPNLSPLIRACVPDLLKTALNSAESIPSADVTVREFKVKIANFVANNISRSWPQDLYEKVARSI